MTDKDDMLINLKRLLENRPSQYTFIVHPDVRRELDRLGLPDDDDIKVSPFVSRGTVYKIEKSYLKPQFDLTPPPAQFDSVRWGFSFTHRISSVFGVPEGYFRKTGDWRTGNPNWTIWDSWRDGGNWKRLWPYRFMMWVMSKLR